MNEPEKPKKGWGCLQWGIAVGITFVILVPFMFASALSIFNEQVVRNTQMKAASNARQIVGLMLTYASENNGHYPDHGLDPAGLTSNRAFHLLVEEGLLQDETIFGCPASLYYPDKNIGVAPAYAEALRKNENHWMLVTGLDDKSPSHYPLVLENAADTSWPPKWHAGMDGKLARGRAWKGNTIILAFNDASVQTVKLEQKDSLLHLPKRILEPEGHPPLPALKVLDIDAD
jgi:hypothetical protein